MTSHETVNQRYAEIQAILRDGFRAEGHGIIQMARDIDDVLPRDLAWKIRDIGRIRNQVVHEGLKPAEIPAYFDSRCGEVVAGLEALRLKGLLPKGANGSAKPRAKDRFKRSGRRWRLKDAILGPWRLLFSREGAKNRRIVGAAGSLIAGVVTFAICAERGHDPAHSLGYAAIGALIGFFWLYLVAFGLTAGLLYAAYRLLPP